MLLSDFENSIKTLNDALYSVTTFSDSLLVPANIVLRSLLLRKSSLFDFIYARHVDEPARVDILRTAYLTLFLSYKHTYAELLQGLEALESVSNCYYYLDFTNCQYGVSTLRCRPKGNILRVCSASSVDEGIYLCDTKHCTCKTRHGYSYNFTDDLFLRTADHSPYMSLPVSNLLGVSSYSLNDMFNLRKDLCEGRFDTRSLKTSFGDTVSVFEALFDTYNLHKGFNTPTHEGIKWFNTDGVSVAHDTLQVW